MGSQFTDIQRLLTAARGAGFALVLGSACVAQAEMTDSASLKVADELAKAAPTGPAKVAAEALAKAEVTAKVEATIAAAQQSAKDEIAKIAPVTLPSAKTEAAAPAGKQPSMADKLTEAGDLDKDPVKASGSTAPQDYVAQVNVQLPFGFSWGQNQEDVRYLLKGIGVKVLSRQVVGQDREAWKLEGFIKPLLIGTTIYFTRGYMEEIEMQFGSDTWQEEDYTRLRRKLVEQFNQVYGPNRVLSNERSTADSVLQTLVGYQWQTQNTMLRVFDFGASNGSDRFRTVSVHYKFRDEVQVASRTNPPANGQ